MKTYLLNLTANELSRLLQSLPKNEHSILLSKLTSEQLRELITDFMSIDTNPITKNNKPLQCSNTLRTRHVKLHPGCIN